MITLDPNEIERPLCDQCRRAVAKRKQEIADELKQQQEAEIKLREYAGRYVGVEQ